MGVVAKRSSMTFFSDSSSHYSHRVRIVLAEKGVTVDMIEADSAHPPAELADLNPYNSLPTLVDRDLVLYESKVMMEYLDERYPHPPLLPVDPVSRANNRQFRFRIVRDLYALAAEVVGDNEIAAANARKSLRDNLLAIAPVFSQFPYFMSEEFSLVDLCMAPLLWRLPIYGLKLGAPVKPLLKYGDKLFERPAFRNSLSAFEQEIRLS